jgi:deoxyribose-phosphate aldolase
VELTPLEISGMIDLSAVRAESDDTAVRALVEGARRYYCGLVTVLPSQTRRVIDLLGDQRTARVGGNVGFPSGGQTTSIKVAETRELRQMGCDEIDMVIDLAALLSGRNADVRQDICAVVDVAAGAPVKVIIECHYLDGSLIKQACDLAIVGGASYVKTGTGWAPTGATLENIALIKAHVGDAIGIKAAGGIRSLETLLAMYWLGARRFGISLRAASLILNDLSLQA